MDRLDARGPVAVVTGGWEERELEDEELVAALGRPAVNLRLHHRGEFVLASNRSLLQAWHERQDALRRLRALHQVRLAHALDACRALLARPGGDADLAREQAAAIGTVRTIDQEHLEHVRDVRLGFAARFPMAERRLVVRQRRELTAILDACPTVAIAGGHVGLLLDQLRLFGLARRLAERTVIAWSAGAMAVVGSVVLFHDAPPQGPGNAEILDTGLGLHRGLVVLPHARRRLTLADRVRVSLFARRFHPLPCVVLDDGGGLLVEDGVARTIEPTDVLGIDGALVRLEAGAEVRP